MYVFKICDCGAVSADAKLVKNMNYFTRVKGSVSKAPQSLGWLLPVRGALPAAGI
ncbi:uncharacterized protein METZ01_LOCUS416823 [marine metagenome]|uniref:Uncharacterized protein n=1 Tax=marine metagenome TaxID=408172 RepID=A0A382WZD8_9ZZZZ